MTHHTTFEGLDYDEYLAALASGVDAAGNAIEPYVDSKGGWPQFRWNGAYRETGPVAASLPEAASPSSPDAPPPELHDDSGDVQQHSSNSNHRGRRRSIDAVEQPIHRETT